MDTKKKVGGARLGSGRPRIAEGLLTVPVMIKMTEAQREKLRRLGGARWVRDRIDKAKEFALDN